MASFKSSSSSSKPTGGWTHDVFLSFRGEDARYTFVDHLHAALVRTGINVFKDDKMLRGGKFISEELMKGIEESRCAVVVFTKNYANSSWCLKELAKIMECHNRIGQMVLPVFYHVDPSDVRGQKNDFGTAFQQHEQKFREEMDKVNEWREALTAAANLSGHHLSATVKEGESAFTNKIVEEILHNTQPCGMEKDLIGIESHIIKLSSYLGIEAAHEVRMVGIYGMGGIGKTTIAKALFRRFSYKFEGSSFVKDVRENSSSERDVCTLQEQILTEVLETHHGSTIKNPEDGAKMIQTRFCNKKVLLVLDDVDDIKKLEFLAATHEWFGAGSRIIVTTRDEHLLLYTNATYEPALLLEEQAVELFSRHAFRENSPPEGYKQLSNRAVGYTGRLPLALEVLGSFFRGRKVGVWESALDRLAKTPNRKIFETLRVSFDGLEDSEKEIFLDIACFFKGNDKQRVTRVLDSFGFDSVIGISVLIEKSLITLSNYDSLGMHDLLQEMGMHIVRKSYPWSRLWQNKEIHDCIKGNKKLEAVEAIVVDPCTHFDWDMSGENRGFSADVFENMKNLRLLVIGSDFTCCEPTSLPDELRWLRWYGYKFSSLPVANLSKLVGLEITSGNLTEQFWMVDKVLPCLKFIDLNSSCYLERLPNMSWAPNVERLILSGCINMVEVDESLGSLKRLVYLDMSGCKNLKCLPSKIEMESLETLILSYCSSLEMFPEVSPCMVKLSEIRVYGCGGKLENSIPYSIREFCTSFSELDDPKKKKIKKLKPSFDMLEDSKKEIFLDIACFFKGKKYQEVITVLDSFGFDSVIGISVLIENSFITLSNYNQLCMHELLQELAMKIVRKSYPCSRLWQNKEIHDFIKGKKKLEAVEAIVVDPSTHFDWDMSGENRGFSADVFENMKNLRLLEIGSDFTCCEPTSLPDELRWLCWSGYKFSSLPVANLSKLVGLEIRFGNLTEQFWMVDKVLPCLKFIDLKHSRYLERLPNMSWAPNVERLVLSGCRRMVEVDESLGSLRRLVYLDMSYCYNLMCLPSRIEMESLETLDISHCTSLETFPEVSPCMVKLSEIRVYGCGGKLENSIPNSIREFCTSFLEFDDLEGPFAGMSLVGRIS